ncbi:MAG: proprotein convertase P-domain-containing protein [Candidatus Limnocylindrales bacterium]
MEEAAMRSLRPGTAGRLFFLSLIFGVTLTGLAVPVAMAAESTFGATPNVAIPDNGYNGAMESMATSTINTSSIPALRFVTNVTVQVAITHAWLGDITIKLRSPSGTILALAERPQGDGPTNNVGDDGAGAAVGDSSDLLATYSLAFNDAYFHDPEKMGQGLTSAQTACQDDGKCQYFPNPDQARVVGNSVGSFNSFDGELANGNWTLGVGDGAATDTGTFVRWGITIVHSLSDARTFALSPYQAIPDDGYNGTFTSMASAAINTSAIPAGHVVTDITVEVAITHTWVGDLTIKLRSPLGTILTLLDRPQGDASTNSVGDDGAGADAGDSSNLSSTYPLLFNDAYTLDAESVGLGQLSAGTGCQADSRCRFFPNPDQSLAAHTSVADFAALDGEPAPGTWTLGVGDSASGDTGTFVEWSISINHALARTPCATSPFTDVPVLHPFCGEIKWMKEAGVSTGFDDNTYRPALVVSRQAMAAFIARLADATTSGCGEAPFTDVAITHPFCPEIAWMKAAGMTNGFADGTYRPGTAVSRQSMSAFMARLAGADLTACSSAPFSDVAITHPFCPEIAWMKAAGISTGFGDGTYRPASDVTRQAMSAFMSRVGDLLP